MFNFIKSLFGKRPAVSEPKITVRPISPPTHKAYADKIAKIRSIAKKAGYEEISFVKNNRMVSFRRGKTRINVFYSTMTVATCLKHEKRGKTQLFRKNVAMGELEGIFNNPRVHTGKGYYNKQK